MVKKTSFEIVSEAYGELEKLQPTPEEIQEYVDFVNFTKQKRGVEEEKE